MNRRFVVIAVAALVFAAVVGGFAYNFGVANGLAQSGKIAVAPVPWGHGFPFFFPLFFFVLFIAFIVRGMFWRGHYRHGCGLEEWHRREHERMWNDPRGTGTTERAQR